MKQFRELAGWRLVLSSIFVMTIMSFVMALFIDESTTSMQLLILNAVFVTFASIYLPTTIAMKNMPKLCKQSSEKISFWNCALCVLIGIGLFFAGTALSTYSNMLFTAIGADVSATNGIELPDMTLYSAIIVIVVVSILPALAEELLFRGVFAKSLERRGTLYAVVMSSLIFAMFHMSAVSFLPIFAVGLVLGLVFCYSHSVITSFIIHFVYNLLGIILTLLQRSLPEAAEEVSILSWEMFSSASIFLGIGVVILIPTLLLYRKKFKIAKVESDVDDEPMQMPEQLSEKVTALQSRALVTVRIAVIVVLALFIVSDIFYMYSEYFEALIK